MKSQADHWEHEDRRKRRLAYHPVVEAYVAGKLLSLKKYFVRGGSILEVGGGNGAFSVQLDRLGDLVVVDNSRLMLSMNPVGDKRLMDAACLDFADDSFDLVFCHAVLHHVEDAGKILAEMRRVSRGFVVVVEPNICNPALFLFIRFHEEERFGLRYTRGFLEGLVGGVGLSVVESFGHGSFTPNSTPVFCLGLLKFFNRRFVLGVSNTVVCKK